MWPAPSDSAPITSGQFVASLRATVEARGNMTPAATATIDAMHPRASPTIRETNVGFALI